MGNLVQPNVVMCCRKQEFAEQIEKAVSMNTRTCNSLEKGNTAGFGFAVAERTRDVYFFRVYWG